MSYESNLTRYQNNLNEAKNDIKRLGKAVGSLNSLSEHEAFGDILRELKKPDNIMDHLSVTDYDGFDSKDSVHEGAYTKIKELMSNDIPIVFLARTNGRTVEVIFFDFNISNGGVSNNEVRAFNNKFELLGVYTVEQIKEMEIKTYDTLVWNYFE